MVTWDHKLYGEQQTLDLLWRQKINYVKAPQKAEEFVSTPKIFGDTGKKSVPFPEVKRD